MNTTSSIPIALHICPGCEDGIATGTTPQERVLRRSGLRDQESHERREWISTFLVSTRVRTAASTAPFPELALSPRKAMGWTDGTR
jgi:hypothetical protein